MTFLLDRIRRGARARHCTVWLTVFVVGLCVYSFSAQRDVSWQDSGMFQWRVSEADYTGGLGLALAHPLYILAAQPLTAVPIGTLAWRMNVFSGIGMAIALANLVLLVRLLVHRPAVSYVVVAVLALSHAVWWFATIAEVYTWVAAGLTTELLIFERLLRAPSQSSVVQLAFVNGLGLSLHNVALLALPVYAVIVLHLTIRRAFPPSTLLKALLAYALGAALFIGMAVHLATAMGSVQEALESALFGTFRNAVLNTDLSACNWKVMAALGGLSFVNVLLPFSLVGWKQMAKGVSKPFFLAFSAITLVEFLFVIRYPVPDQFSFLLPTLVLMTLPAAFGLEFLLERSPRWRTAAVLMYSLSLVGTPLLYGSLPAVLSGTGVIIQRTRQLPFRDEVRYWVVPWKHDERSARLFADAALAEARPNGVILADGTALYPLLLTQAITPGTSDILLYQQDKSLPPFDRDSTAFWTTLDTRSLFVVTPLAAYLPSGMSGLLSRKSFKREHGSVLYRMSSL